MGYYNYTANVVVKKNDGTNEGYTITKSGRSPDVPQGGSYGVYVPFHSTESYTREGYDFTGYKFNDSGTAKQPGDTVPFWFTGGGTQNQYWYCQWQLKTYTISYNANGGSGAPDPQTKTHGTDLTLSATVPTRTNYNFQGWATDRKSVV